MFIRCEKQPCRIGEEFLSVGDTLKVSDELLSQIQYLVDAKHFSLHQADPNAARAERKANKAPKRTRDTDGHYKADDPATETTNEAWEGGKPPQKNLDSLKKNELLAHAKKLGVGTSGSDTKASLIKKIQKAKGD